MLVPLLMLLLTAAPWLAVRALSAAGGRPRDLRAAGALGLGLVFAFTAVGHFARTEAMAEMLPAWVPARAPLVRATGVLELALAAGFFLPRTRHLAGLAAIALLVCFFPVNVHAALERVDMGGHAWGPAYLLVRAPLQAFLATWAWWFTVRTPHDEARA